MCIFGFTFILLNNMGISFLKIACPKDIHMDECVNMGITSLWDSLIFVENLNAQSTLTFLNELIRINTKYYISIHFYDLYIVFDHKLDFK